MVIIDYGMGNHVSVRAAIQYLGADAEISSDPDVIGKADKLILPGVGSFFKAMENIQRNNLFEVIHDSVNKRMTPILGICLGMQLLGLSSTEDGLSAGFGFIGCLVERFNDSTIPNLKVPHVGFDVVSIIKASKLLNGLDSEVDFYFTHSYRLAFDGQPYAVGTCFHGEPFIAAFEQGHICGTQFHPEKSQTNGLITLKNFIEKF